MTVEGNSRYVDLLGACAAAEIAGRNIAKAFEEIKEQLKRIESKKTLGIRLTKEERAIWLLYGVKTKKEI